MRQPQKVRLKSKNLNKQRLSGADLLLERAFESAAPVFVSTQVDGISQIVTEALRRKSHFS
jgi:hypothetical protein